ncbi:hypothetical protein [Lysobacter enzymogenes]|uniref:Uncharacterized protein n=1 Tax=Lysobacter enzymogenes TaxID=69 RepID=A0A0S2DNU4_LYSEN|nr:hypothetical protein [Lysobacter enzymogenes]ALN60327.1 hypothetical protein GLE_4986 [Lysobacter enzymogenes]QCW28279.1 hypothetical protein FE772_24170 [Lysobacter enzymogenes]QQQ01709.1 hypothetical protein JHW41_01605 [Lysobacter enzymogenes]UZW60980.1 hypothetical protein BV903_001435 [Lysobacter enzymogenes]
MSRARKPSAKRADAQVSTVRYEAGRAPEPEINIVNLSDSEFVLLQALRGLAAGRIEVVVQGARIVEITRSERVEVTVAGESWG